MLLIAEVVVRVVVVENEVLALVSQAVRFVDYRLLFLPPPIYVLMLPPVWLMIQPLSCEKLSE